MTGEYKQNLCIPGNRSCLPCAERLPSCVGLPNGQNAIVGDIWSGRYVKCLNNRTMVVGTCPQGWFHPVQRICVTMIHPGNLSGKKIV